MCAYFFLTWNGNTIVVTEMLSPPPSLNVVLKVGPCIRLVFQRQNNIDMGERGRTVEIIIIITVKTARQLELSQQFCPRL